MPARRAQAVGELAAHTRFIVRMHLLEMRQLPLDDRVRHAPHRFGAVEEEALTLAPSSISSLLNYGNLQWKLGQKEAARDTFTKVLELDHQNRNALASLGYLARDAGDTKLAESYFTKAAAAHPKDYTPYLALGDLYAAERNFRSAESHYEDAYQRMPGNPLIVAGGANAALQSHNQELAKHWLDRANGKMNESPQVSRERERYLTLKGDYAESAKLGYAVIEKFPHDREGVVST